MNLARTDVRFVLPDPVRDVEVSGFGAGAQSWRALGLSAPSATPELTVFPDGGLDAGSVTGSGALIVDGDAAGQLRSAGRSTMRLLVLPDNEGPALIIPYGRPNAARYALGSLILPSRRWKSRRNAMVAMSVGHDRRPLRTSVVTVAAQRPGPPFLIARAAALGVPQQAEWVLLPGQGDGLARGVFQVFAPGAAKPDWVLKFSRSPGRSEPFERDARGLALARSAGGVVAAHAPRLLGRLPGDVEASLESAGHGASLLALLTVEASRTVRLEAIERIAEWTVAMGGLTAQPGSVLAEERRRLTTLAESWGMAPDATARLDGVPGVLQHNDLGAWNIVVDAKDFTVLDWESARRPGLPLWDLWYFLADVLAHLDGASDLHSDRESYVLRLFRGELASSQVLFAWTRRAVSATQIPPDSVGTLALLSFLHHGTSWQERERDTRAHRLAPGTPPWLSLLRRLARHWLEDPQLGPDWSAWRAGSDR